MKTFYQFVSDKFNDVIEYVVAQKDSLGILVDSTKDFTRNRKLSLPDIIKSIIFLSGKPIKEELYQYFHYDPDTASASAFVQQRAKIKPLAFELILNLLNKYFPCLKKYYGFNLLAIDGSDLAIPYDENDLDTFMPLKEGSKGCNLMHINATYDILNHRYVDVVIKGRSHSAEPDALITMVERLKDPSLILADRNFPSWRVMEHIIKAGHKFLIRCQDIDSPNGILKRFNLPHDEFDLDVKTTLTNVQNKETKSNPEKYRFVSTSNSFEYLDENNHFYPVQYRVVRFKIDGDEEYESIITNLDREQFPASKIKELYFLRWNEETSFRHLKYSANLSCVHCRKRESIKQEIWARMVLYNLSMIMIEEAFQQSTDLKKKKYTYSLNITRCIHIIRDLSIEKAGIPPTLQKLLVKELLPIRPNRVNPRKVRPQGVVSFNYRFS